jgi:DNA-binding XRE family transcriptional regulator
MAVQFIATPGGEKMAVLPAEEYQDLIDARDAEAAMREVRAGRMETFTEAEVDAYLASPSPLAFWRKRRGLTQAALAEAVGKSQAYLAQIEAGRRTGTVDVYARLASVLKLRIEDLLAPRSGDDAAA